MDLPFNSDNKQNEYKDDDYSVDVVNPPQLPGPDVEHMVDDDNDKNKIASGGEGHFFEPAID